MTQFNFHAKIYQNKLIIKISFQKILKLKLCLKLCFIGKLKVWYVHFWTISFILNKNHVPYAPCYHVLFDKKIHLFWFVKKKYFIKIKFVTLQFYWGRKNHKLNFNCEFIVNCNYLSMICIWNQFNHQYLIAQQKNVFLIKFW